MDYANILVIEENAQRQRSVAQQLEHSGCTVEVVQDQGEAYRKLSAAHFDAILTHRQGIDGGALAFLDRVNQVFPQLPVVFYPDHGLNGMDLLAHRSILKPNITGGPRRDDTSHEETVAGGAQAPLTGSSDADGELGLVGRDLQIGRVRELIGLVANSRTTVLITGEGGTGKTVVAKAIHRLSDRSAGPFVEVSCGAIPEGLLESELFGHVRGSFAGAAEDRSGKFELADGGTIFLDEISCVSPALQVKLLRVLQDRTFDRVGGYQPIRTDVRVILATSTDLKRAVEVGHFRRDLYYRVNVLPIEVPPLRDRKGDIEELAKHFISKYCAENGRQCLSLTEDVLALFQRYAWPGNVRELENLIERCVVLAQSEWITPDLLPAEIRLAREEPSEGPVKSLKVALEAPEREIIERALDMHHWHRGRTAAALKIDRTTLYQKMRKHGFISKRRK